MSIALLATGGTIACTLDADGRAVKTQRAADLLASAGARDVTAVDQGLMSSWDFSAPTMLEIARRVDELLAEHDAVVVTQGTDTLEESAFLADLVWPHPQPLVFTGAMRNPTLAGPDGPANLLAAVRVASSPAARDLGALVVFKEEIHAARWVRKTHSTSTATFASPNTGPIGQVVEDRVRILTRPLRLDGVHGNAEPARLAETRVALHTVTMDDDGLLLPGLADTHQGLVVGGFGVGHVPARLAPVLGDLATRMPVVLTSRTGAGSIVRNTYHSPGSETDLLGRGLIDGGFLDPYKARILLRLLLATNEEIVPAFQQYV